MLDELDESAIEEIAGAIVADGLASNDLRMALDQLVADRANGESLDVAAHRLRRVLEGASAPNR